MSSVKRQKVGGDVPSGLLNKKKQTVKGQAPLPVSPSPEPTAEELKEGTTEATKTFKDLVRAVNLKIWTKSLQNLGHHRLVM
jgi:hypothetical protein